MSRLLFYSVTILLGLMMAGPIGCKSKKKVEEADNQKDPVEATMESRLQKIKDRLNGLIANEQGLSIEDREKELAEIKALNIQDEEVQQLITQLEEILAEERRQREEQEAVTGAAVREQLRQSLNDQFDAIAEASSTSEANELIEETLGNFSSPDVPLLIIISDQGDVKDYDRPTTIARYLNYLKDRQESLNEVASLALNDQGKITQIELKRK